MKLYRIKYFLFSVALIVCFASCKKHLVDMNVNPNGSDPKKANPNLVLSTVLTQTGSSYVSLAFDDVLSGLMQHTQKDGWGTSHNDFNWGGNQSWAGWYGILRNNQFVHDRSVEMGYELQEGITLVMKSMLFGLITDLWGDAPYLNALKGAEGGNDNTFPVFDSQESIYRGIIKDLERANTLLSKNKNEYTSNVDLVDVYYQGNPAKWRKLANSLQLRYYMRVSSKLPDFAKDGITRIISDPANLPIILAPADDAAMGFVGTENTNSWPINSTFSSNGSEYRRIKMASTLVEKLRALQDPRIAVWANKVQIPIVVDAALPPKTDKIDNGKRYISPDVLQAKGIALADISQNPDYVGIPPFLPAPQVYNLSPDVAQASTNPHVSWINTEFSKEKGALLKARLMSASEVNFILAEAALKGWAVGDAKTFYEAAIKASFTNWGVSGEATAYLGNPDVAYKASLEQLMEQKWISGWTAASEAWFDFRRTGFPKLKAGGQAVGPVLPVRFYYMVDELNLNKENANLAISKLETTPYSSFGGDGKNSAWSKPWVLQGTGKPW